jgi:hypothetical protein
MKNTNPIDRYGKTGSAPTWESLVLLIMTIFLLSNCSSIMHSGNVTVPVKISTTPPGADIYIDGRLVGKSPSTQELNAKLEKNISLEHPSYAPFRSLLRTKICASYWLNFFFFWGFLIDAFSGNMYEAASPINFDLTKTPLAANFDSLSYYRIPEFAPPPGTALLVVYRERVTAESFKWPVFINDVQSPNLGPGDIFIRPFPPGKYSIDNRLPGQRNLKLSIDLAEGKTEFVKMSIRLVGLDIHAFPRIESSYEAALTHESEEEAIRVAYYLIMKK